MFIGYIDPGAGYVISAFGGWIIVVVLAFLGIFLAFFKKMFGFVKKKLKRQ